jgi:FMN phosphatase YigB (HAD superfamily)
VTVTLLLDLDDTLLKNPMGAFLPAYLKKLSGWLAEYALPEKTIQALMAGTQLMVQNRNPGCYLREVFDQSFFQALGIERQALQPVIDEFYESEFPTLQALTEPMDGVIHFIEQSFARGYRLGIATNALFPLTAIRQRLAWAGLSLDHYPFQIVPSYEMMHFAKPNPAFFCELLACMGWFDGPVVVIGDDYEADIQPANQSGLATYWINGNPARLPAGSILPTGHGKLIDVLAWIDSQSPSLLEPRLDTPTAMAAILRSTPAALHTLCTGLEADVWNTRPKPGEWCAAEILCHLRDVEVEVNQPRIRKLLGQSNPFIPGIDTDRWAEERQYVLQNGPRALQRFTYSRRRSLRLLDTVEAHDWKKSARHTIFGPITLEEIVNIMAAHDRLHICQIYAQIAIFQMRATSPDSVF